MVLSPSGQGLIKESGPELGHTRKTGTEESDCKEYKVSPDRARERTL